MSDNTSVIDAPDRPRQIHLRRMRLTAVDGPAAGVEVVLDRGVVHIGSHADNDLTLADDTVSRFHAEIDHTPNGIVLRDLGSTNGTWIGEVRVREVYLGEGQRVFRVGHTTVHYTSEDEVVDILPAETDHFEGLVARSVAMREVFSVLDDLVTAMNNNDTQQISDLLDPLDVKIDENSQRLALIGTRLHGLGETDGVTDTLRIQYLEDKSIYEDIDITAEITKYTAQENSLTAVVEITRRLLSNSLSAFLR